MRLHDEYFTLYEKAALNSNLPTKIVRERCVASDYSSWEHCKPRSDESANLGVSIRTYTLRVLSFQNALRGSKNTRAPHSQVHDFVIAIAIAAMGFKLLRVELPSQKIIKVKIIEFKPFCNASPGAWKDRRKPPTSPSAARKLTKAQQE